GFFDFKFAAQNGRIAGLVDHMPDWTSPAASTGVGALVAPDGLQATVMSSDQIRLTWNDRSNTEQQFEIERRVGGGSFQLVGTVGANVEAYSDASLAGGMTYTYRVRARSGTQTSDYSAPASASIPSQGEAPPTGLTAQAVSASEIQLGWSDNAGSEDGYRVEMRSTGDFELLQSLPADSTAAAITGLDEATLYTFRVQATGGLGDSSFSNEASAMTFGDVEPCVPGPSTLCLNGGRFKVEIVWSDFAGANGTGIDAGLVSEDSGLLYFFDENNLEMLVKVLDGCAITNHFWVFAAATTDVEYTLTATDTFTGSVKTYSNPLGNASPAITDTEAFATCDAVAPAGKAAPVTTLPASALATGMLAAGATKTAPRSETTGLAPELKQGTCIPGATSLCLNEGRFRVEVDWVTADDVGMGQVDAFQSADSGLLWFFSPNNLEMLVKVLDGCAVNDRVWVFAAATTDVEYTLRVTDTVTGEEKRYLNAAGNAADAITDTDAFAACP
ncbi:MAG: fibronectin type III domain-containing protein, partial [Acidobacteriota bacterium]